MADEDERVESIGFLLKSGNILEINGTPVEQWLSGRSELPPPSPEATEILIELAKLLARRAARRQR